MSISTITLTFHFNINHQYHIDNISISIDTNINISHLYMYRSSIPTLPLTMQFYQYLLRQCIRWQLMKEVEMIVFAGDWCCICGPYISHILVIYLWYICDILVIYWWYIYDILVKFYDTCTRSLRRKCSNLWRKCQILNRK